jgi:hypothetical protein
MAIPGRTSDTTSSRCNATRIAERDMPFSVVQPGLAGMPAIRGFAPLRSCRAVRGLHPAPRECPGCNLQPGLNVC